MTGTGAPTEPATDLTLYHSATSVCSAKVRLVLSELEIDWQSRLLDLAKGDQFEPSYLELNPHGVVPTLVDNGLTMTESNDIMRHLCRRQSGIGESLQSAECDVWLERSLAFHDAVNTFTQLIVNRDRLLAFSPKDLAARLVKIPNSARADKLTDIVENGFASKHAGEAVLSVRSITDQIDKAANRAKWLAGDTYTLADAAMLPFAHRLELLGLSTFWQTKPSFRRWFADAMQRPSFRDAVSSHISGPAAEKFAIAAERAASDVDALLQ